MAVLAGQLGRRMPRSASQRPTRSVCVPRASGQMEPSAASAISSIATASYDCDPHVPDLIDLPDRTRFRMGVGVCLTNKDGLVFAAQRCDDEQGTWQMPQGGIDEGEEPSATALRELFEETGIRSAEIVHSPTTWFKYIYPTRVKCSKRNHYITFDGQVQRWFLLRFTGDDSEINLDRGAHTEFKAWRWMRLEDLPANVVDFKKNVYEAVAAEFGPLIAKHSK